jgi:ABC-type hemin transport system ATPase subunit
VTPGKNAAPTGGWLGIGAAWPGSPLTGQIVSLFRPASPSGGAPHRANRLLALARRFSRQGIGVLAVLHDLNLAATYADRIAVLKGGRLVALGTPAAVLQPELIERVFAMMVRVLAHPGLQQPLVVPVPALAQCEP